MRLSSQKAARGLLGVVALVAVWMIWSSATAKHEDERAFDPVIDEPFYVGCQDPDVSAPRANAAIVILARNSDIQGVSVSMSSFERHFNRWFHYPYVILNDEPFTDEFKETVSKFSSADIQFGQIDAQDWNFPDNVPQSELEASLNKQGDAAIPYGRLKSYHQMCRYFSGKFYNHPLLQSYDWYWRVEPDIQFFCDLTYDPFVEMERAGKVYGFNAFIAEVESTVPSLYRHSVAYKKLKGLEDTDLWPSVSQCISARERYDRNYKAQEKWPPAANDYMDGCKYNMCHFWSNFEIARFDLWRQPLYQEYFEYLEQAGGFWHERWGDAPVHTFGVAMLLNASQVHYFRDIGYQHTSIGHCPNNAPGKQIPLSKYGQYTDYDSFWADADKPKQFGTGCRCKCPPLRETETHSCFDKLLSAYGNPLESTRKELALDAEFEEKMKKERGL